MKRGTGSVHLCWLIVAALPASPARLVAAGPPAGAQEVVRLSILARGGESALKGFRRKPHYVRMIKTVAGDGGHSTIKSEKWVSGDGRQREVERISEKKPALSGGFAVSSHVRTTVWDKGKVRTTPPGEGGFLGSAVRSSFTKTIYEVRSMELLLPLLDGSKGYELSMAGEEMIGRHRALNVKVRRKGMPDVLLSFDRASWLLLRSEVRIPTLLETIRLQTSFNDYQPFDGLQLPRKLTATSEIEEYDVVIQEYRLLKKVDDALFR